MAKIIWNPIFSVYTFMSDKFRLGMWWGAKRVFLWYSISPSSKHTSKHSTVVIKTVAVVVTDIGSCFLSSFLWAQPRQNWPNYWNFHSKIALHQPEAVSISILFWTVECLNDSLTEVNCCRFRAIWLVLHEFPFSLILFARMNLPSVEYSSLISHMNVTVNQSFNL